MNPPISQQILELPHTIPARWQNQCTETEEYAYLLGASDTRAAAAALVLPIEDKFTRLADALRELRDVQHDAPLEGQREQWQAAIDKADAILKEVNA